jgi:hypothetical protein
MQERKMAFFDHSQSREVLLQQYSAAMEFIMQLWSQCGKYERRGMLRQWTESDDVMRRQVAHDVTRQHCVEHRDALDGNSSSYYVRVVGEGEGDELATVSSSSTDTVEEFALSSAPILEGMEQV